MAELRHYRVTAQVTWEVESDKDTSTIIDEQQELINSYLSQLPDAAVKLRIGDSKTNTRIRIGEFAPEDVFPYLTRTGPKKIYKVDGEEYEVKMSSQRYFVFRHNMKCVCCGLSCKKIFLERQLNDKHPHFNFYALDNGKLLLLTKDHIHPRSCGGQDCYSNYQTMCVVCNNLKGASNVTLEGLKELRAIYNEIYDMPDAGANTKKKLFAEIDKKRKELELPRYDGRKYNRSHNSDYYKTNCDICLYEGNDCLLGKSSYSSTEDRCVGCIKKGEILEPLAEISGDVLIQLENLAMYISRSLLEKV